MFDSGRGRRRRPVLRVGAVLVQANAAPRRMGDRVGISMNEANIINSTLTESDFSVSPVQPPIPRGRV